VLVRDSDIKQLDGYCQLIVLHCESSLHRFFVPMANICSARIILFVIHVLSSFHHGYDNDCIQMLLIFTQDGHCDMLVDRPRIVCQNDSNARFFLRPVSAIRALVVKLKRTALFQHNLLVMVKLESITCKSFTNAYALLCQSVV